MATTQEILANIAAGYRQPSMHYQAPQMQMQAPQEQGGMDASQIAGMASMLGGQGGGLFADLTKESSTGFMESVAPDTGNYGQAATEGLSGFQVQPSQSPLESQQFSPNNQYLDPSLGPQQYGGGMGGFVANQPKPAPLPPYITAQIPQQGDGFMAMQNPMRYF